MAAGLGVAFYDEQGHLLRHCKVLHSVVWPRIDTSAVPKALQEIDLQVLTDVTNASLW